jgi:DNA-binding protein HU-beta
MNQSELVTIVTDDTNLNRVDVAHVVESTLSAISHELAVGGDVRLLGFGSFTAAVSPARDGHNPKTGAKLKIAARVRARFKEGKGLKETLNPVRLTGARRRVG